MVQDGSQDRRAPSFELTPPHQRDGIRVVLARKLGDLRARWLGRRCDHSASRFAVDMCESNYAASRAQSLSASRQVRIEPQTIRAKAQSSKPEDHSLPQAAERADMHAERRVAVAVLQIDRCSLLKIVLRSLRFTQLCRDECVHRWAER